MSIVPESVRHDLLVLGLPLAVRGECGPFVRELTLRDESPGVAVVTLRLTASQAAVPPRQEIVFRCPVIDIHGIWRSSSDRNKGLMPSWAGSNDQARATSQAPVICAFGQRDDNRLAIACGDALHPTVMTLGIVEETAELHGTVVVFSTAHPATTEVSVEIRFDRREIAFHRALHDVAIWWAQRYVPLPVPDIGRRPMYSTWYSFHQVLEVPRMLEQCRIAKQLGCDAVIVDDGWQTLDGRRGYAYCGDWLPERIPAMAAYVAATHALGMAVILWYAAPFIGYHSAAYQRFTGCILRREEWLETAVLDPRFPAVREYLIELYAKAVQEWDLDGFKLDFVDSFRHDGSASTTAIDGRDYADVDEAVDRLLADVMRRLRALKPNILIEFRQSYTGPLMRTYGNLLRAGDCPADAVANRVRTLDVRLLAGSTATHADMLMWHPDEPVDAAALQFLNIIFSVPQLSVLLDGITDQHRAMVTYWTGWWNEHRDVLLDGLLEPRQPALLYPVVVASTADKRIVAVYSDVIAEVGSAAPAQLWVVNGTRRERVVIELAEPLGPRTVIVRDCCGREVHRRQVDLSAGVHRLDVPPAGSLALVH